MSPAPDFDPQVTAKTLLREARSAALATATAGSGAPYCSLVNVATAANGDPILLISQLAVHTRNVAADPRVSLLLRKEGHVGDPLEGARVSVGGRAVLDSSAEVRRRYLARHPDAAMFADFKDFGFYRVSPDGGHLVAGFGRIVDLSAEQLRTDLANAAELVAAEAEICAHLNEEHADTLRLYATGLLGAPDGAWRCLGCDPEGLDLANDDGDVRRLPFPRPVAMPGVLRAVLKHMAEEARARTASA